MNTHFWQDSMVGIRERTCDNLPRGIPLYFLLIYQDARQLRNGKRRMSLVGGIQLVHRVAATIGRNTHR